MIDGWLRLRRRSGEWLRPVVQSLNNLEAWGPLGVEKED
jgi:hypothetical protein